MVAFVIKRVEIGVAIGLNVIQLRGDVILDVSNAEHDN